MSVRCECEVVGKIEMSSRTPWWIVAGGTQPSRNEWKGSERVMRKKSVQEVGCVKNVSNDTSNRVDPD
jgi:hypothetical protein